MATEQPYSCRNRLTTNSSKPPWRVPWCGLIEEKLMSGCVDLSAMFQYWVTVMNGERAWGSYRDIEKLASPSSFLIRLRHIAPLPYRLTRYRFDFAYTFCILENYHITPRGEPQPCFLKPTGMARCLTIHDTEKFSEERALILGCLKWGDTVNGVMEMSKDEKKSYECVMRRRY